MKVLRRPTQDTAATTILRLIKRLRGFVPLEFIVLSQTGNRLSHF